MANCKILGTELKKLYLLEKCQSLMRLFKNIILIRNFFEMEVGFSEKLSLLQLLDHPKPEMMFNENYPFLQVVLNL